MIKRVNNWIAQVISDVFFMQCIEQMGVGCFTEEQMTELIQLLNKTLSDYFERQVARQGSFFLVMTLFPLH